MYFQFKVVQQWLLLLCLLLFSTERTLAQHFPVTHYGKEEGLPDSDVYDLWPDGKGRLWLATGQGLSSFDGIHFKHYPSDTNGRMTGSAIRLVEDSNNQLWIGTLRQGVFVWKDETLNSTNIELTTSSGLAHTGDQLWVLSHQLSRVSLVDGKASPVSEQMTWKQLSRSPNGDFLGITDSAVYQLSNEGLQLVHACRPEFQLSDASILNDNTLLLGGKGRIEIWTNNQLTDSLILDSVQVTNLLIDKAGRWWFSDKFKGLLVWENDRLIRLGDQLGLHEITVTQIVQDQWENLWVSTLEQGLFKIHHCFITNHNTANGYLGGEVFTLQEGTAGKCYLSTRNQLMRLSGDTTVLLHFPGWRYFQQVLSYDENRLVIAAHPHSQQHSKVVEVDSITAYPHLAYALTTLPNGKVVSGYYADLLQVLAIQDTGFKKLAEWKWSDDLNQRTTLLHYHQGQIWQGTTLGLRILDTNGKEQFQWPLLLNPIRPKSEPGQFKIVDLQFTAPNQGFLATMTEVYRFERDEHLDYRITLEKELQGNITAIAIDLQNCLWVGTHSGLWCYPENGLSHHFSAGNGLVSNEVTALLLDAKNGRMRVGTNGGISTIDLNAWARHKEPTPTLAIAALTTRNEKWSLSNTCIHNLDYRDFLTIALSASHWGEATPLLFEYRLDGAVVGNQHESRLILASLTGGEHQLVVRAKSENSPWSNSVKVNFYVNQPWYTRTWVWVVIGLAAIIGALVRFIQYQKQQNHQLQEKMRHSKQINQLQLQSLGAMMHPHFVSNVVTAVRQSFRQNKHLPADQAMARLGRLMRMNLEMVQQEHIDLGTEIERLTQYVNLEKYARNAEWEFHLLWPEGLVPNDFEIPPMLLQPFLENAIVHGLQKNAGRLELSFVLKENYWHITITDSGPGWSEEIASSNHISNGVRITQKRLNLLTQETQKLHQITFQNGRNEGLDFGLRVLLELPVVRLDLPPITLR